MLYVVMVVPAAASVTAETKRSAAAEAVSLKPGEKNARSKFAGSLPSEVALSETTHSSSSDSSESMENLAISETNSGVTAGISRPKERSKTGGSLRNVIDYRELPVAEKEAREFTAVARNSQSQLSIVDKAGIESLPSVSHKAVAIFPSVATKRKLATTAITDTASLRTAVSAWCANVADATTTYGHISTWDTSSVTNMSYLFAPTSSDVGAYCSSYSTFNSNISTWNGKGSHPFVKKNFSILEIKFFCLLFCVIFFMIFLSSIYKHYLGYLHH